MFLKQSTNPQYVVIGPFLDEDDGKTAETGLTISNTDIRLSKNGGNIAAKNTGGATHDEIGLYQITLNATDTDTVGELLIAVHESGALPVFKYCYVLEEAIYDAMFAASATLAASVADILQDTATTIPATIATVDTVVDAVKVVTDAISTNGSGLSAVPWNASWDAEVQSEVADALAAYDPPTKAEMDAMWTTDIVEAYAGPTETACTPAQMLYMILSCVGSYKIESDKIITLKLDESTQAMRFDMDSTTNPTYRKRDA